MLKKVSSVFLVVALAVVAVILWRMLRPGAQPNQTVYRADSLPITVEEPIKRSNPEVPAPAGNFQSRVRIIVQDTVKGSRPDTIDAYIPTNPKEAPVVFGPANVTVSFASVVDSWAVMKMDVHVGISVDNFGLPSPDVGFTALRLWGSFYIGAGASRSGLGPEAYLEVWREFCVLTRWNLIAFRHDAGTISLGLAYRL